MSDLISYFLGVITPPIVVWILGKISPRKAAMMFSKWLGKIIKDPKALDKIEDAVGKELVEIGEAIIKAHQIGEEPNERR